jgi:hypothetical protein
VRNDVVPIQVLRLAAAAVPADIGAAALVAAPDDTADGGGHVARSRLRRTATAWLRREPEFLFLDLSQQSEQRAFDDGPCVSVSFPGKQVLKAA